MKEEMYSIGNRLTEEMKRMVLNEGAYLGNGILKVDKFINHQVKPQLMNEIGSFIGKYFENEGITKILTAESSGIVPAYATANYLNIPMVFARKKKPITMKETFCKTAPSHTKGGIIEIHVSREMISNSDKILIVDDFLASGKTLKALAEIVLVSGAVLCGVSAVIEKVFENGREILETEFKIPVLSVLKIGKIDSEKIEFV